MTAASAKGLPTPGYRNCSARAWLEFRISTSWEFSWRPWPTRVTRVFRHQSKLVLNDAGFEAFCGEKSEYRDFSLNGEIDVNVGNSESRKPGLPDDMAATKNRTSSTRHKNVTNSHTHVT